jgi:hypothetical protein
MLGKKLTLTLVMGVMVKQQETNAEEENLKKTLLLTLPWFPANGADKLGQFIIGLSPPLCQKS